MEFTKQFIWITGILNTLPCFVTAIYMPSRGDWSDGIVLLIFGLFAAFCFHTSKNPFSVLILLTAIDVFKNCCHVYLISSLGCLLATVFAVYLSVTMVAVCVKYGPLPPKWATECMKNVIHTTISGMSGACYFNLENPSKGATRGAARCALTYSFGSK